MGFVSRLLHQGDGKRTGGDHVGGGVAGDGTHQGAGDHRGLGRAAAGAACQRDGDIHEELTAAGGLQEAAEQDKHDNDRRGSTHRRTEDAVRAHIQVGDDAGDGIAPVTQHTGQIGAEVGVCHKDAGDNDNGPADRAPRAVQQRHHQQNTQQQLHIGNVSQVFRHLAVVDDLIKGRGHAGYHHQDAENTVCPVGLGLCQHLAVNDNDHQQHHGSALQRIHAGAESGRIQGK